MDAWDGEEPMLAFIKRVGPVQKVPVEFKPFEDVADFGFELPDGKIVALDPSNADHVFIIDPATVRLLGERGPEFIFPGADPS